MSPVAFCLGQLPPDSFSPQLADQLLPRGNGLALGARAGPAMTGRVADRLQPGGGWRRFDRGRDHGDGGDRVHDAIRRSTSAATSPTFSQSPRPASRAMSLAWEIVSPWR